MDEISLYDLQQEVLAKQDKSTTLVEYGITDAAPLAHIGDTGAAHGVSTDLVNGFMSSTDKIKLDSVDEGANNYVHPSEAVAGTYKSVTIDEYGHVTSGTNPTTLSEYGITDATAIDHVGSGDAAHALATTTTSGFLSAIDKTKLDGISELANNYTHPTGDGNLHVPATDTTNEGNVLTAGATAGSLLWSAPIVYTHPTSGVVAYTYKSVSVDENGHVTSGTNPTTLAEYGITDAASLNHNHDAVYATIAHVGDTGSAHGLATTSVSGFMSYDDKTKLDSVESGAIAYSHPIGDGNLHVPATGITNAGNVLTAGSSAGSVAWAAIPTYTHPSSGVTAGTYKSVTVDVDGHVTAGTNPTTLAEFGITDAASTSHNHDAIYAAITHVGSGATAHSAATTSVDGFMSSSDKIKLDSIAESANAYSHPTGDGNLHVPATGTSNNGKVLTAGATAGSLSWGNPTGYTHPTSGVTAGTYRSVTVDANGHITSGTNPTTYTGLTLTDVTLTNFTETTVTASGSGTYSINLSSGTLFVYTMNGNTTFSFPTATIGKTFTLVCYHSGSVRTISWPSSVLWPKGEDPVLSDAANKYDVFTFTCITGTAWIGMVAGIGLS
jgi:phage-related tail fiber protein